ncbi:hypothetical protein LguiB_012830 [Lonicera macranthoides]
MASVACINYWLAVIVLVIVWLAGIINVLAVTSTNTTANNINNSSQPAWLKRESEAVAGIPWWANMSRSTSHCEWDGIGCNEAGSVTFISCLLYHYHFDGEVGMDELNLPSFQNLEILDLFDCGFKGTIPFEELGNLKNLSALDLGSNLFSGPIPSSVGFLTQLTSLYLNGNRFTGSIPYEIGKLSKLTELYLFNNSLSGPIPSSVGFLTHLTDLDLSRNQLTGSIPPEIGNLKNLLFLDLRQNIFSGLIPSLSNLSNLNYLRLRQNNLLGTIPPTIGLLNSLGDLDLSHNFFSGTIPANLSDLPNINLIDLSYNKLVGPVPTSLWELCSSSKIQLVGNYGLESNLNCKLEMKDHNKRTSRVRHFFPIIILPVIVSLALLIILAHRFFSWRKTVKNKTMPVTTKHGNMCSIWNYDGTIAYDDIIRSTNDFDIEHCIGTGGYGSVYRAQLPSGKIVALKKLHRFEAEEPAFDKSFKNEVEVLSNIRHKNIVKLYGFCLHNRCMFLVYEYMERGSLFSALRDDAEAVELDWTKRVTVVKGIAHALSYMHHDCTPPIAHRDISSNNILLNSKQDAFVADFGAARLLSPDSSNQTVIAGTRGYIAPGD